MDNAIILLGRYLKDFVTSAAVVASAADNNAEFGDAKAADLTRLLEELRKLVEASTAREIAECYHRGHPVRVAPRTNVYEQEIDRRFATLDEMNGCIDYVRATVTSARALDTPKTADTVRRLQELGESFEAIMHSDVYELRMNMILGQASRGALD